MGSQTGGPLLTIKAVKSSIQKFKVVAGLMALLLTLSAISSARSTEGSTSGGSVITNQASATYSDDTGEAYDAVSDTVSVTVLAVASIAVSPDETAASDTIAPREQATRVFRVCNTGNTADSFTLTQSSITSPATISALYFDIDGSGTLTSGDVQITLNQTVSPQLAPGSCLGVLSTIDTNDTPPQSTLTISITARSTAVNAADGHREDPGTIINAVGVGARLTDPSNASLAPSKLVNDAEQAVVSLGTQFSYTIAFRNSGDTPARNVVMSDPLPAGVEYVAGSLQLNDRLLTDAADADEGSAANGHLQVRLAIVNPGEAYRVTLSGRTAGNINPGVGLVNNATFTADNAAPVKSTDATVVVDPFGLGYPARGGRSSPIPLA